MRDPSCFSAIFNFLTNIMEEFRCITPLYIHISSCGVVLLLQNMIIFVIKAVHHRQKKRLSKQTVNLVMRGRQLYFCEDSSPFKGRWGESEKSFGVIAVSANAVPWSGTNISAYTLENDPTVALKGNNFAYLISKALSRAAETDSFKK